MPQHNALNNLRYRVEESAYVVEDIDSDIKSLYPLTNTLKQHPNDEKYAKLVEAIDEIVKTWQVVDDAFKKVFLLFNPKGDLHDALSVLLDLDAEQLRATVHEGRGHCHRIGEIYWYDIKDWANNLLKADDQQTLNRVFDRLGNADNTAFHLMEALAAETGSVASNIMALVMADQQDEARKIAKGLYELVSPLRQKIIVSLSELKQFQSQFADLAPEEETQYPQVFVGDGGIYFDQSGQVVEGNQVNAGGDANIGHIGDQISVGDISGLVAAIGSGAEVHIFEDFDPQEMIEPDPIVMEDEPDMTMVEPPAREDAPEEMWDDDGAKGISFLAEPPASAAEETVWQTRRVDLAMPATANINETTELRALIALLNSDGLRKHLPDYTEGGYIIRDDDVRDDAQVDLQFPADNRPLIIYMRPEPNADDFELITKARRIVLFPDRDSNQLTFLLKPLRALGTAYVPVELYADAGCTEPLGSAGTASTTVFGATAVPARTPEALPDRSPQVTYVINGGTVTIGDVTTVGNISHSSGIAIGTQATVTIHQLFEPLQTVTAALPASENRAFVEQKMDALQQEVEKGESADDQKLADLISDIAEAAPTAVAGIVNLFTNAIVAKAAGAATNYILKRIRK